MDIKLNNIGAVAIPIVGNPTWELMRSIVCINSPNGFRYMTVGEVRRPLPIDEARNKLVLEFLKDEKQLEWLFFVDSDATLCPGTLNRLLSRNKPVVSALCFMGHRPVAPSFFSDRTSNEEYNVEFQKTINFLSQYPQLLTSHASILKEIPDNSLEESGFVGMHATLIRREVFENIEFPYFKRNMEAKSKMGEDEYFCRKARDAGYEIYVDMSVVSGHQKMIEISGIDFQAWCLWMQEREEFLKNESGD